MNYPIQNSQLDYFRLCEHPNIITSSLIKDGVRSSKLKNQTNYAPQRTKGSLIHAMLLEKANLSNYFEVVDDEFDHKLFDSIILGNELFYGTGCQNGKNTKAFKDAVASSKSRLLSLGKNPDDYTFLTSQEYDMLKRCNDIVVSNKVPISKSMLMEANKQASLIEETIKPFNIFRESNLYEQIFICDLNGNPYTVDQAFSETRKPLLMCKPDILVMGYVNKNDHEMVECIKYFDIKTTSNANFDSFRSQCYRLNYYFQQAFYYHVISLISESIGFEYPVYHGGFIAASTENVIFCESVNPSTMNSAMDDVTERIRDYRMCFASGNFTPRVYYEYI